MANGPGGAKQTGWAAIRPVLVAFLLVADAVVVAALGFSQRKGWLVPFIAFGVILVGLFWFEAWSLAHRHDDD